MSDLTQRLTRATITDSIRNLGLDKEAFTIAEVPGDFQVYCADDDLDSSNPADRAAIDAHNANLKTLLEKLRWYDEAIEVSQGVRDLTRQYFSQIILLVRPVSPVELDAEVAE